MPVSIEPDGVHDDAQAHACQVAHEQAQEEGGEAAVGVEATEAKDEGFLTSQAMKMEVTLLRRTLEADMVKPMGWMGKPGNR